VILRRSCSLGVLFLTAVSVTLLLAPVRTAAQSREDEVPQDSSDLLRYLRDNALSVHILARVVEPDKEDVWLTESRKVTISGRAVQVKLSGENLVIFADIIPYMNADRTILLVAKGQVWAQEEMEEGVKYYSTMKSLPVESGESVLFFPLGRAMDQQQNIYSIELEITVVPYQP
jgi:hypothetical protein